MTRSAADRLTGGGCTSDSGGGGGLLRGSIGNSRIRTKPSRACWIVVIILLGASNPFKKTAFTPCRFQSGVDTDDTRMKISGWRESLFPMGPESYTEAGVSTFMSV